MYKPEGLLKVDKDSVSKDLQEIIKSEEVLEGTVEKFSNNTLIVNVEQLKSKGVIDIEDFEIKRKATKPISMMSKVGKRVQFVVTGQSDGKLTLSRKRAQEKCAEYIKENLHKGEIIQAVVLDSTNTEVYIDLGCGYKAVIYREDISMVKSVTAQDHFYKGQKINVVIKEINEKGVFATHKELLGTFDENIEYYDLKKDDTVIGKIQRISKHGVYISIGQNIVGLAEKEDLEKLDKAVTGDYVAVHIKAILPQKVKIKLSIVGKAVKPEEDMKIHYFIKEGSIKVWKYSPEGAIKVIESRFDN